MTRYLLIALTLGALAVSAGGAYAGQHHGANGFGGKGVAQAAGRMVDKFAKDYIPHD